MPGRRIRRLLVGLLVVVIAGGVAFVTVKPFRVAVQTLALVPELLDLGPRPVSAFSAEPVRISTTYGDPRPDRLDLYLPRGAAPGTRYPALLLVLGVNRVPLDDPRVVRFASTVSRLGLVVAAPESTEMKAGRIGRDEPARLVDAFRRVLARPEVDPECVGLAGFSVGGSIALVAAADPRIASRVAYVNAFGAYADASQLLVDVATRSVRTDGGTRDWQPGETTKGVFLALLLDLVDDRDAAGDLRTRLAPVVLGGCPSASSFDAAVAARLDPVAAAIYRLATAGDRGTAEAAIASLPASVRDSLRAISPAASASAIRAPVYLMHDEADDAIPFAHLDPLATAIPAERLRRKTAFRLFDHVEPGAGIGAAELPETWKLFWHLHDVLNVAL